VLVWVHVFMNTYMWVCVCDSKLIVKHAYILLLPTYTLSVCLSRIPRAIGHYLNPKL
jgi:protein involved in ribonucleotide reduction